MRRSPGHLGGLAPTPKAFANFSPVV
jgi:hypothetical protein